MKRMKAQQKKRKRPPVYPTCAMVVCDIGIDVKKQITPQQVASCYQAMRYSQPLEVIQMARQLPNRRCWENVAWQIDNFGGDAVFCWAACPGQRFKSPDKNIFHQFDIVAHCLWRHENELWEVTEGNEDAICYADENLTYGTGGEVYFFHNYQITKKWWFHGGPLRVRVISTEGKLLEDKGTVMWDYQGNLQ